MSDDETDEIEEIRQAFEEWNAHLVAKTIKRFPERAETFPTGSGLARQRAATGDTLPAEARRHKNQIASQFHAGQVDRVTLVTTELEVASTALSRFDAVVRRRQAIGALEDALHQPLFDPGHWPIVPTEQNAILSRAEPSS